MQQLPGGAGWMRAPDARTPAIPLQCDFRMGLSDWRIACVVQGGGSASVRVISLTAGARAAKGRIHCAGCRARSVGRRVTRKQGCCLLRVTMTSSMRGKEEPSSGKVDESCIKHDGFCIKNDEFCIKNDEYVINQGRPLGWGWQPWRASMVRENSHF